MIHERGDSKVSSWDRIGLFTSLEFRRRRRREDETDHEQESRHGLQPLPQHESGHKSDLL